MATTDKNTLIGWFRRGAKPLASQFAAWFNSYWHKEEKIPIESVDNLNVILGEKIDRKEIENITGKIMLERRIPLVMNETVYDIYISEAMTIYRADGNNVQSLAVVIGDEVISIELNKDVSVEVPARTLVKFSIEKQYTAPTAYLFIYAKAKV